MTVPRRNGFTEDDAELEWEAEDEELLDEGWIDLADEGIPVSPDVRALMQAAELGDENALRLALGPSTTKAPLLDQSLRRHHCQTGTCPDNLNGSVDESAEDGDTALHLACLYGYLPCVQILLQRGASLDSKDEDGAIPLHDACAGGFIDIVEALLDSAKNKDQVKKLLDTVDVDGDTPLHHAARGTHLEVVQLLLGVGASPSIANVLGKTPGDLAEPDTEVWRTLNSAVQQNMTS